MLPNVPEPLWHLLRCHTSTVTEQEAKGKPCEADGQDSRFEALLSDYQAEAIENAFLKQQEPEPDVEVEIAQKVGKIREHGCSPLHWRDSRPKFF